MLGNHQKYLNIFFGILILALTGCSQTKTQQVRSFDNSGTVRNPDGRIYKYNLIQAPRINWFSLSIGSAKYIDDDVVELRKLKAKQDKRYILILAEKLMKRFCEANPEVSKLPAEFKIKKPRIVTSSNIPIWQLDGRCA